MNDIAYGFVDHITNHTNVARLGRDDIRAVMGGRTASFSPKALLIFIHESIHHWTFSSLVGDALAVVSIRELSDLYPKVVPDFDIVGGILPSESEFLSKIIGGSLSEVHAVEQLSRVHFARLLLNPITEGLAIFGELDVVTILEKSNTPPPFRWLTQIMGNSNVAVNQQLSDPALDKARLDRRANYYMSQFAGNSGGHLGGYCFVRSICQSLPQIGLFNDPINILVAIKTLVFEDAILANLLLDESLSIDDFCREFTDRYCCIVDRIVTGDLEDMQYAIYESEEKVWPIFSSIQFGEEQIASITRCPKTTVSEAVSKLDLFFLEYGVSRKDGRSIPGSAPYFEMQVCGLISRVVNRSLLSRRYCSIGSCEVEISVATVGENISISIGIVGQAYIEIHILKSDEVESFYQDMVIGDCRIELYLSEVNEDISMCVVNGNDPIAILVQHSEGRLKHYLPSESQVFGRNIADMTREVLETPADLISMVRSELFEKLTEKAIETSQNIIVPHSDFWDSYPNRAIELEIVSDPAVTLERYGLFGLFLNKSKFKNWLAADHSFAKGYFEVIDPDTTVDVNWKIVIFLLFFGGLLIHLITG